MAANTNITENELSPIDYALHLYDADGTLIEYNGFNEELMRETKRDDITTDYAIVTRRTIETTKRFFIRSEPDSAYLTVIRKEMAKLLSIDSNEIIISTPADYYLEHISKINQKPIKQLKEYLSIDYEGAIDVSNNTIKTGFYFATILHGFERYILERDYDDKMSKDSIIEDMIAEVETGIQFPSHPNNSMTSTLNEAVKNYRKHMRDLTLSETDLQQVFNKTPYLQETFTSANELNNFQYKKGQIGKIVREYLAKYKQKHNKLPNHLSVVWHDDMDTNVQLYDAAGKPSGAYAAILDIIHDPEYAELIITINIYKVDCESRTKEHIASETLTASSTIQSTSTSTSTADIGNANNNPDDDTEKHGKTFYQTP